MAVYRGRKKLNLRNPSTIVIIAAIALVVIFAIISAIITDSIPESNENAEADMSLENAGITRDIVAEYIVMAGFSPNHEWIVTEGISIRLMFDDFLVTDGTLTWSLQEAFPSGISEISVTFENTEDFFMLYGRAWYIERLEDGVWHAVEFNELVVFDDEGLGLSNHDTGTLVLDFSMLAEPLSEGIYRITGSPQTVWPTEDGYIIDSELWTNFPPYQLEFLVLDVSLFDTESVSPGDFDPEATPRSTLDAAEIMALNIDYSTPIPIEYILNNEYGYEEYYDFIVDVARRSALFGDPLDSTNVVYLSTVPIYWFDAHANRMHNQVRVMLFSEDFSAFLEVVFFWANNELNMGTGNSFDDIDVLRQSPNERFIWLYNIGTLLLDSDNNIHFWSEESRNELDVIGNYYGALNHSFLGVSYSMLTNRANLRRLDLRES